MLNQRTQWFDYIEQFMKITNVNPNKHSESSDSLYQSNFTFRICDISLPQYQTVYVYFLYNKKNPLCPRWINAVPENYPKKI